MDLWQQHKGTSLADAIREKKHQLKQQFDYKKAFDTVRAQLSEQLDDIAKRGSNAIVDINYQDIQRNRIPEETKAAFYQRGACVVRGVFNSSQIQQWDDDICSYIQENNYIDKATAKAGMDKYFSSLQASAPQIYNLYWSKPQIEIRQAEALEHTRLFLNGLWHNSSNEVDLNTSYVYADRVRRRAPGDSSLGLSPHVDGGSVERWLDDGFNKVYASVFQGNVDDYQPYDVSYRSHTYEIPSPAVCRMFRTYQGWTALTDQGPGDGTLQLVPTTRAMVYVLLRALQDDIADDDLCGATPGRALQISSQYHQLLLDGLVSIPKVQAGDTVWWHSDIIHAVEDVHTGTGYSNVIYTGAAPACKKNTSFLQLQRESFLAGNSAPDFAAENYEVDFHNRATKSDLSPLGLQQMGF